MRLTRAASRAGMLLTAALLAGAGCTGLPDEAGRGAEPAPSSSGVAAPSHATAAPGADPPAGIPPRGPEGPHLLVDGVVHSAAGPERDLDRVGALTAVSTGLVVVDIEKSVLTWHGWTGEKRTIGRAPWSYPALANQPTTGLRWALLGNPDADLVAFVEAAGGSPGAVVVARASTGAVLGSHPLRLPAGYTVRLASVDASSVAYAAAPAAHSGTSFLADNVRVWPWADRLGPRPGPLPDVTVLDVSAGIWAVTDGTELRFHDGGGRLLSTRPAEYQERTAFGAALSPDGRYWYGPASGEVVDTATGDGVRVHAPSDRFFGWTGAAELTLVSDRVSICDPASGRCADAFPTPSLGSCERAAACGYALPLN